MQLDNFSMDPDPQKLAEYLKRNYPEAEYRSVYEAGFSGFEAHRTLCKLGVNNIVINPADVPTSGKLDSTFWQSRPERRDCQKGFEAVS